MVKATSFGVSKSPGVVAGLGKRQDIDVTMVDAMPEDIAAFIGKRVRSSCGLGRVVSASCYAGTIWHLKVQTKHMLIGTPSANVAEMDAEEELLAMLNNLDIHAPRPLQEDEPQ